MTVPVVQRLLKLAGIPPEHRWVNHAHRLRRAIRRTDAGLLNEHLKTTDDPKLHIGSSWHVLEGWLNTDVALIPGVMRMDATRCFPFRSNTFAYVFTEHMIEHIQYEQLEFMLGECHRVTRIGGTIRVTTPNLAAILGLYREPLDAPQREYLAWFCKTFLPKGYPPTATFAINAFVRYWGHQFIYDEFALTYALRKAGFRAIKRQRLGESDEPELRNLEFTERSPEGMLEFESIALEATK
jgi:predicted SAM-dependent methyltransferase